MTPQPQPRFDLPAKQSVIESLDLAGMRQLAVLLVKQLPAGTTVGLVGTLGAGKTALVQAIAAACEFDAADVTSPTFTLLQSYRGPLTLHHLDAYRIADEYEFFDLGVDELFADRTAITLVEWADRVFRSMPPETFWIEIKIAADPLRRNVTLASLDTALAKMADAVADQMNP